ncbi:MAG: sugar phosphate isomerase/epimerase [Clostridiales bacterium]|nr:sugar phosphate isomerase/epimerase [Clostridiales bacterium]
MTYKIGVIIDSFRLPIHEGIKKAKEVGADGIQIYAVKGSMNPDNLSKKDRSELLDYITSHGLEVSALCGDLGGGFMDQALNKDKITLSKKIIDLALDLNCDVVTTHIGVVPTDKSNKRYDIMQQACEELGEYADQVNASFAIETGPEASVVLRGFLDSLTSSGVRVNFDPANLVMVIGEDPVQAVKNLAPYIVHTHAKDGKMLLKCNPEDLYMTHGKTWDEAFIETPLGEGNVNFPTYLKALGESGYKGFLTIEREVGKTPYEDIKKAVQFLRRI